MFIKIHVSFFQETNLCSRPVVLLLICRKNYYANLFTTMVICYNKLIFKFCVWKSAQRVPLTKPVANSETDNRQHQKVSLEMHRTVLKLMFKTLINIITLWILDTDSFTYGLNTSVFLCLLAHSALQAFVMMCYWNL